MDKTTPRPSCLADPTWHVHAQEFSEHLAENQRRWFAGLLSLLVGRGGPGKVGEMLGLHVDTVRRGKREVEVGLRERPRDRVRLAGAGCPLVERRDPTIEQDLAALVEPETAGDPCRQRKWTRKSLRQLAKALRAKGPKVERDTVKRLLKKGLLAERESQAIHATAAPGPGHAIPARRAAEASLLEPWRSGRER